VLEADARRIAAAMEERLSTGAAGGRAVTATVHTQHSQPEVVPRGAGRPTFIRYHIQITDGTRVATLDMSQAAALLEDMEPGWDPDRLFDAIRSRDVPVDDTNPDPGRPPDRRDDTTGTAMRTRQAPP
jgi:hypothetical protein